MSVYIDPRQRPTAQHLLNAAAALREIGPHKHSRVAGTLEHIAAGRLIVATRYHVHYRDILGNGAVRRTCGGITRRTLLRWRDGIGVQEPFPRPIRKINGVELWSRAQVRAWLERNRTRQSADT